MRKSLRTIISRMNMTQHKTSLGNYLNFDYIRERSLALRVAGTINDATYDELINVINNYETLEGNDRAPFRNAFGELMIENYNDVVRIWQKRTNSRILNDAFETTELADLLGINMFMHDFIVIR